ncbi:MAG TPA: lysine--tRNA ligase [Polyangiaceae bacterium]
MSQETSGEDGLREARLAKAARVRARGENPFPNDVAERTPLGALRAQYAGALLEPPSELRYALERVAETAQGRRYHVVGRLVARRGFGKASFLGLRDATGELQLFAKKDTMGEAFDALADIDIADHVEAGGRPMVTKTGELSLELDHLRLLGKALRPLPDKWHGLVDTDVRYRRRYVDLIANPEVYAVIGARACIVRELRAFLDARDFVEVETPTLHSVVGGAAARPFTTHHNALDLDLFLRIAPELYLKRLLVGGFERVYEIGRCYRNEGLSTRHNPEFTMLEFYQAYASYTTLMPLTEELLRDADRALESHFAAPSLSAFGNKWRAERSFTLDQPFVRLPMREGLAQSLERARVPLDLLARLPDLGFDGDGRPISQQADDWVGTWRAASERAGRVDWRNLRRALGACESDGERVFIAYEYLVEPFLAEDYRTPDGAKSLPVFILDYPADVSPLARKKDGDPSLVDRFELFVDGRELCNAFSELNDPEDQAARFREQVAKRSRGAAETMDYDADYILALEHGMPPAAGFGLGIDRATMALTGQSSIRDVIAFPLLRPESDG